MVYHAIQIFNKFDYILCAVDFIKSFSFDVMVSVHFSEGISVAFLKKLILSNY